MIMSQGQIVRQYPIHTEAYWLESVYYGEACRPEAVRYTSAGGRANAEFLAELFGVEAFQVEEHPSESREDAGRHQATGPGASDLHEFTNPVRDERLQNEFDVGRSGQ